ncbi:hypothetical protein [Pareuzebyella sediminis]|uniref:hypothetical protein n=1 Tax=Pareuzebyella sediminis TaxID=2607998 RepID=UPI0011EE5834|nr:hypothetical protein [Pareuzebyella sediminis]
MKKIGFNNDGYLAMKGKQEQIDAIYERLEAIGKKVLGVDKIADYGTFMAAPYDYLVNEFWALYGQYEPGHTSKERFLDSKIKVDTIELEKMRSSLQKLVKEMGKHAPNFSKAKMTNNLKKSDFAIFLNPEKEEEYNALENFINAARVLRAKYNAGTAGSIVTFHNNISLDHYNEADGFLKINTYEYAQR